MVLQKMVMTMTRLLHFDRFGEFQRLGHQGMLKRKQGQEEGENEVKEGLLKVMLLEKKKKTYSKGARIVDKRLDKRLEPSEVKLKDFNSFSISARADLIEVYERFIDNCYIYCSNQADIYFFKLLVSFLYPYCDQNEDSSEALETNKFRPNFKSTVAFR